VPNDEASAVLQGERELREHGLRSCSPGDGIHRIKTHRGEHVHGTSAAVLLPAMHWVCGIVSLAICRTGLVFHG